MMYFDVTVQWLHLSAAILWIGGMAFTTFVVSPILREQLPPPQRGPLVQSVGRRFRRVEAACLAVLLATGAVKVARLGGWPLFRTSYGHFLILKLHLIGAMLGLAVLHAYVWGPRLASTAPGSPERDILLGRLVFWARVSLGLGFAVVLCGAWLHAGAF